MRTGVYTAAAVFLVACGLVALAANQGTFFSHQMKTTRLAQFSELDTIKVHVPGSGTSIIHAGQGKAVHEYEVNTKGLPDISGSLKALSGEVANLKSHVQNFAYKAAKAGSSSSNAASDDEVKSLADRVQGLVTSMNARYPAASVRPRSGSQMKVEAEHVSKLVEQVKALAQVVDKRFIGPNGKPNCSPHVVLKLIRAVDELGQQVRMSLPNAAVNGGVPGATLSAQNIVDAATIVNAARRAQKEVGDAQHAREKLVLAARRSEHMATATAAIDKVVGQAAKSAKTSTKQNMGADRSDGRAAKSAVQAAEASASTVASGNSKRSAKDAAEIAAGAITSANILDRAVQAAREAAKSIATANALSAKLIEEQKSASKAEAKRLAPGIALIVSSSKGDTKASIQASADAAKAENAVTRIAVASSDSKKTAAAAVAAADVAGAKAGAAVMSDNNLRAAKRISQMDASSYLSEARRLAAQLSRVAEAQKACAKTISSAKNLEQRDSGTSATSTDDIAAAKNAANAVADQQGRKSKDAAGEDAAAAAAAAELNTAKEAAARLATANEAAARVSCANLELIKKQIAKLALAAANAARIAAHNVQAANAASRGGEANKAAEISDRIASASLHTAMIKAKADARAAQDAYQQGMADVRKAKRAADLISQAVSQANKDMKDDELAAETAARKVDKIQNAAQNALNAENRAAAAAAADGSPDIAAADAAAAKVARQHVKEGRPASADVNAAAQALDANRRAARFGDQIAVNSLSAAADGAAILAGSNKATAKALTDFHRGRQADLKKAIAAARARTAALRKMRGERGSINSVTEKKAADAEAAAEKAAAAALLGGGSKAAIDPQVVLAAVRRAGVPVDAANILAALRKAGVKLTPASIAAALKNAGLSAHHIARILKSMGIPAHDIAKALSTSGAATDPASLARAMAAAGMSPQEIASALSNSGLAPNVQSIQQALHAAGLKLSIHDIRKAIASNVAANPGPIPITPKELLNKNSGVPQRAADVIAALREAGVALTPANIAAALKKAGLSAADIAKTFASMNVSPQIAAEAMRKAGFSDKQIVHSMSRSMATKVLRAGASSIRALRAVSPRAASILEQMRRDGIPLTPANIAAALKKAGLSPNEISHALMTMGVRPDVCKTAMIQAGFGPTQVNAAVAHAQSKMGLNSSVHRLSAEAQDVIAGLRRGGVPLTPENIAAAFRKAGMSPAQIAAAMATLGNSPEIIRRAMHKAGISHDRIHSALNSHHYKHAHRQAQRHLGGGLNIPHGEQARNFRKYQKYAKEFAKHGYLPAQMAKLSPRARDIIAKLHAAGGSMSPKDLVAAFKAAGMSPSEIAAELAKLGIEPGELKAALKSNGFTSSQIAVAMSNPKVVAAFKDARKARIAAAKYGGVDGTGPKLSQRAQDIIAQMQRDGIPLTPANIAAAMKKAGLPASEMAKALAVMGIPTHQIRAALSSAGVSPSQIERAMQNPAVKQAINFHKNGGSHSVHAGYHKYAKSFAKHGYIPSQMANLSPRARSIIERLRKSGGSMAPADLVAAFKAAGMSPSEIAAELAKLGIEPAALKAALRQNGYTADQIAKVMSDPAVVQGFSQARQARITNAKGMSKKAQSIIDQMRRDGIPLTPANIAAALRRAGLPASELAHTLATMGIPPHAIQSALRSAGVPASEIAAAMSDPAVKQAIAFHSTGGITHHPNRPTMPTRAASVIEALKRAGVPLTPENIANAMRKAGLSAKEMAQALLSLGVNPQTIGDALKKAGVPASEVNAALRHPSIAHYIEKAGGMPAEAHDIIAALKKSGVPMTPENILAALRKSGMSTEKMMATMLAMGYGPSSVRHAMRKAGIAQAEIEKAMAHPSVQKAMKHAETNGMPREAVSVIDALKKSGKPLTPANIIAALKAKGMSPADIAKTLMSLGIKPDVIGKALQAAGYTSDQIHRAVGAARGMPAEAHDIIQQLRASGKPMTPANIIAALQAKGLSPAQIMRTMLSMGISLDQCQAALTKAGVSPEAIAAALNDPAVKDAIKNFVPGHHTLKLKPDVPASAKGALDALKRSGKPMTPANIIAALKAQGLSTTEIMKTMLALGINPNVAQQAMAAAGIPASEIQAALADPQIAAAVAAAGGVAGAVQTQANGMFATAAGCAPCQVITACQPGCSPQPLQVVQPCGPPAAPQPVGCQPAGKLESTAKTTQLQQDGDDAFSQENWN
jgi:lambda repressor-like predicted transcriptional regulator